MSMTRIYADGRRDDLADRPAMRMDNHAARIDTRRQCSSDSEWLDTQPAPAEACTDLGANQARQESSWRLSDAVIALIAVGCVAGYFAGVFA